MTKPSLARFHRRLGTLCAEIEVLENRAHAAGWTRVANALHDAKTEAMRAEKSAAELERIRSQS